MKRTFFAGAVVALLTAVTTAAGGPHYSEWSPAQKLDEVNRNHADINTPSLDGCPILSPDGKSLYIASDRPGGKGGLDIWVAHRKNKSGRFGAPVNLPAPINTESADFCPTPVRGGLYFVSRRVTSESCGLGDIYFVRHRRSGWGTPVHLGCEPRGPNTDLDEQGPSLVHLRGRTFLYFSRSVPVPPGTIAVPGDIYVSRLGPRGFGSATAVEALNDATANDIQPNIRRDGLEIVFSSSRPGWQGSQDIWVATRASTRAPWSAPVNVGPNVNTAAAETRPSFSRSARTLLFGRAPGEETAPGQTTPVQSDIYISTRERIAYR